MMPMQRKRKWHSLEGRSVFRRVLFAIGATILSVGVFGLVVGLWWLVSHLVVGSLSHLLQARLEAAYGVLVVLLIWIALLAAALACALVQQRRQAPENPRQHPVLHPGMRH